MTVVDFVAPLYLAIGIRWAISEWRAVLERPGRPSMPALVTLVTGILIFIIVIATWPIAFAIKLCNYIAFVGKWLYDGFTNPAMRRLFLIIIAMGTVNLGVLAIFDGPAYTLTMVWGWAFALATARMGYDIGAYAPRRVVGRFKAVHVDEDGTETPVSGRLLLDSEPPAVKQRCDGKK